VAEVEIQELNRLPFTVSWVDADGNGITPSTSRWRVDCLTTGNETVVWTLGTGTQTYSATIPATANSIINQANESERKRLTVQADYGTADQLNLIAEYTVLNNRYYS
jgi:hypothetical protein